MENRKILLILKLNILLLILPVYTFAYKTDTHSSLHKNILQEYQRLTGNTIGLSLQTAFIKCINGEASQITITKQ